MSIIVTTQKELDAAIESGAEGIVIDSPPAVWLELRGMAHVVAQGSSRVVAWNWSRVDARGWSAIQAWGYSHVNAVPWVTVYRHSTTATVNGGTIVDATLFAPPTPAEWAARHGIVAQDGVAVVYKAVSQELVAGQGRIPTTYTIGSTVDATDWDPTPDYGYGLHFSPTPYQASLYYQGIGEPRFLACEVDVASLVPLGNKCKAPSCRVLYEVDQFGEPVVDALDTEQETMP